jgi:hypothetical protein
VPVSHLQKGGITTLCWLYYAKYTVPHTMYPPFQLCEVGLPVAPITPPLIDLVLHTMYQPHLCEIGLPVDEELYHTHPQEGTANDSLLPTTPLPTT